MIAIAPRVASVAVQADFKLAVVFEDGLRGIVDCKRLVFGQRAGVFSRLRDASVFDAAYVDLGAVTWPGELDLAPDAMYDEIQRHGTWVID